jgi:hypothetical protein
MSLLSLKRSVNDFNKKARFHLFDTLFYLKLGHLMDKGHYNFLEHFGTFVDKRVSAQLLTPHSVLLFAINNEDHDYALLAVDILARKLIIYDCVANRCKETFVLPVKKLRLFLTDYFEYVSIRLTSSESSFQGEGVKNELFLDQVESWRLESGVCSKAEPETIKAHG